MGSQEELSLFDSLVASLMQDYGMPPAKADRIVGEVKSKYSNMDAWNQPAKDIPIKVMGAWYEIVKYYMLHSSGK